MSAYFVLGDTDDHLIYEVDIFEWSCFVADPDNVLVDLTELGGFIVSTVFLGRGDMWGDRPTEFFETTVYKNGIKCNEFTSAHETWDQAKLGHLRIVDKIQVLDLWRNYEQKK